LAGLGLQPRPQRFIATAPKPKCQEAGCKPAPTTQNERILFLFKSNSYLIFLPKYFYEKLWQTGMFALPI